MTVGWSAADVPDHQLGWRMAVLPFRSLGAPLGRGIALGMAEEVSAALGRFRAPRSNHKFGAILIIQKEIARDSLRIS